MWQLGWAIDGSCWARRMVGWVAGRVTGWLLFADRFYWNSYDPHNVAEAMFALANIISFARVSFVLPANELFGPMQISLARMITVGPGKRSKVTFSLVNQRVESSALMPFLQIKITCIYDWQVLIYASFYLCKPLSSPSRSCQNLKDVIADRKTEMTPNWTQVLQSEMLDNSL